MLVCICTQYINRPALSSQKELLHGPESEAARRFAAENDGHGGRIQVDYWQRTDSGRVSLFFFPDDETRWATTGSARRADAIDIYAEMKKTLFLFLVIAAGCLLWAQNSVSIPKKSSDPAFTDITVTSSSHHLLLFAMLTNGFTDEMVQGLHSGLPIHFSFFIEMKRQGQSWKDDKLVSLEVKHIISYDTLKEIYKVEIEESGKRFYTFQTLEEAQKAINEINGLKVIELSRLKKDVSYSIRLRAELYKKTLPMGLHEVVPFVSWWDIKTGWYSISFSI